MTVQEIIALQRGFKAQLAQQPIAYRIHKLELLRKALKGEWQQKLVDAMRADFGKGEVETRLTEILPTLDNIKLLTKHLKSWTAPKRIKTPIQLFGSTSYTEVEPKGNTLIISPWNYPIFLTLHPFCTSFAAGNTAILKPSELTPHTSAALAELIAEIFDPKEAAVVQGGVEVATELLDTRFDHIFFTGSTAVGKIVMQAAAKHLTSVTLELGGKSPTIIDNSANAYSAGQRIAWAKFTNAGQICIAPDHIYVHEAKLEDFKKGVQEALDRFYGSEPTSNPDYVQIVNNRHFKRLTDMMEAAKTEEGEFFYGGEADSEQRRIAPTVVIDPPRDGALMKEEIFGPLLPVFTFEDLSTPLEEIASREHPLVVYIYSKNKRNIRRIQKNTRAGATAINMSLLQLANSYLPFGGTGQSGIGKTNGHSGFLEFCNTRSSFYQWGYPVNKILSAPFTPAKLKLVQRMIKSLF